jgi:hypothetical protein
MNINQLFLKLKKKHRKKPKRLSSCSKRKIGVHELARLGIYT